MFRTALVRISEIAVDQVRSRTFDLTKQINGVDIDIGLRSLITNIIQRSYRYCIRNHIQINNGSAVFVKVLNMYSSSRIIDKELISVKESVAYLIDELGPSKRPTTTASIRLMLIMYILVRSYRFIKR
jgi:hypothetical protein